MKALRVLPILLMPMLTCAWAGEPPRPNILLILSDDHGYADVGVHGAKDFATPHLDSIARNGVRCTSGYVTAPQCAPTRCGLLTGRYQQRFGYEYNNDAENGGLPLSETTIAERLRRGGYVTGAVGKWHLGRSDAHHPLNRGFTEFYGFLGGGHAYIPRMPGKGAGPASLLRNREPIAHTKYLTDQLGDAAAEFVARHASVPWFLYLAFNAPHVPLQAAPEYLQRVAGIADPTRRTYAAMVTALDDNIGRVLDRLRSTGQEQRTLVIFLADNGGPLGGAWNGSSNAPFSGQKGDTAEGGIRVPFFAQWKGTLPAGKTYDAPVISLDLAPTFLAAAGVRERGGAATLDGVNLLPAWKGEAPLPSRALFWRFNFPAGQEPLYKSAVREGDWKLVKNWERGTEGRSSQALKAGQDQRPTPAPRASDDRPQPGTWKLFNLREDPAEKQDRAAAEPERMRALRGTWDAWNAQLKVPFDGVEPAAGAEKGRAKKGRKGEAK